MIYLSKLFKKLETDFSLDFSNKPHSSNVHSLYFTTKLDYFSPQTLLGEVTETQGTENKNWNHWTGYRKRKYDLRETMFSYTHTGAISSISCFLVPIM